MTDASTPAAGGLLAARVLTDAASPFLTVYDDATGERTELSGATAENWVSKAANLLAYDLAVEAGELVAVRPEAHWHTAVLLLGAWRAGVAVTVVPAGAGVQRLEWAEIAPELPAQPDRCTLPLPRADQVALLDGARSWTQGELVERAALAARARRSRLLSTAAHWPDGAAVADCLVAPLLVGGSLVISLHTPPDALERRVASERVGVVLASPDQGSGT